MSDALIADVLAYCDHEAHTEDWDPDVLLRRCYDALIAARAQLETLQADIVAVRALDTWLSLHPTRRIAPMPGGGVCLTLADTPHRVWASADSLCALGRAQPARVSA